MSLLGLPLGTLAACLLGGLSAFVFGSLSLLYFLPAKFHLKLSSSGALPSPPKSIWITGLALLFFSLALRLFQADLWPAPFLLGVLAYGARPFLLKILEKNKIQRKVELMRDLFPQNLGMAIQALKVGQTLPQVVEYLSKESPAPLREEWERVRSQMDLGASTDQALENMGNRYPALHEFQGFLQSFRISRQTGADLTRLLETLREGMEEKNRLERKVEALTAQARLSGLLVGFLPLALGVVLFFMDPSLILVLFTQKTGWALLLLAVVLESLGFLWIRQLLKLEA